MMTLLLLSRRYLLAGVRFVKPGDIVLLGTVERLCA